MDWSRRDLLYAGLGAAAPRRPANFLFILADDLGWADLGCYGSTFHETPHIDRLAGEGMRFTEAYSAGAVCSPTRSSIMTGRYPARVGITDYLPGLPSEGRKLRTPDDLDQMPLEEVTFAETLKQAGYQTHYAGKWHLGGKGFSPLEQGFDGYSGESSERKTSGSAELYTRSVLDFFRRRDASQPFCAFISYHEPHTPITAREPYIERFRRKAAALPPLKESFRRERDGLTRLRQDNPEYASMLSVLDEHTGRLLAGLKEAKADRDTVVIFTSDNGGLATLKQAGPTCNAPLRSGKGWLYEGGIRIPLIVRAPGVGAGTRCDSPVITCDFFPTMLDLAGLPAQPKLHVDAASAAPLLRGGKASGPRTLYWHYPHYHGSTWAPGGALRDGDWKLIEFFDEGTTELYNLATDLAESQDLAARQPAKTKELKARLAAWRQDVGARMPVPR